MAQYIHFEIATSPDAHWMDDPAVSVVSSSPDVLVLLNYHGTETRLFSSAGDLAFDPLTDSLTGTVDSMTRTDSGGAITYEAITGFSVAAPSIYPAYIDAMIETALAGDDLINGWSGPDKLLRNAGNDIVDGGQGGDYMDAGTGDDTYILRAGDGGTSEAPDQITEAPGYGMDTIRILGLSPADVRLLTPPPDAPNSGIRLALTAADGSISYSDLAGVGLDGVNAGNIERVLFDDGTVWDLTGGFTIVGTEGDDKMFDTRFDDTFSGAGGNDSIYARFGGDDVFSGGAGRDYIEGGPGNDTLRGDDGNDSLIGDDGDDRLDEGAGAGYMAGSLGDDTYILRAGEGGSRDKPEELGEDLGEGTDTIRIIGLSPADVSIIDGTIPRRGDMITFALKAEDGSFSYFDLIAPNEGNGSTIGQRFERVVFDDGTVWDLTQGIAATGTDGGDLMIGTPDNDSLAGLAGDDTLRGYGGNDTLDGGVGSDTMLGGLGDDTYVLRVGDGGGEFESIHENSGEGTDTIRIIGFRPEDVHILRVLGGVGFSLTGPDGAVHTTTVFAPGNGTGTDIGQRIERVVFDDGTVWDLTGALRLNGTDGDDTLVGTPFGDTLDGFGGNDAMQGFDGDDLLRGGEGDDLLEGGRGIDVLLGGDGIDMLKGGEGDDRMSGAAGNDTMLGGEGNDWLSGGDGNDFLDGGLGADTMSGAAGDDIYVVDNLTDIVVEGRDGGIDEVRSSVSYVLGSRAENLVLDGDADGTGNKFDNQLTGSDGANSLSGMSGRDRLEGGGGDDTLAGGRDSDTFVFRAGFGHDTITDFAADGAWSAIGPDHDIIQFDRADFANTAALFARMTPFYHGTDPYFEGTRITTENGDTLVIENVTVETLQAHPEDFQFV